jgi:antirestriction protein
MKTKKISEEMQAAIDEHGEEIVQAAIACDVQLEDIGEAYAGEFSSDEEFTQNLLKETDGLPKDLPTYIHIDWEATARDIMMDYCEDNWHYFRSL